MNLIHGITTFNRLDYLKNQIETWLSTIDRDHRWVLIVADDGSIDGTVEYLKCLQIEDVEIKSIFNTRRGIHHQVNQILKECHEIPFDVGFMAEDDIFFKRPGWDDLYISSMKTSGFDHLVYFNKLWVRGQYGPTFHDQTRCVYDEERKVQSEVAAFPTMGSFWTFTEEVLRRVGYFDCVNFGISGNGHTDYTIRCCRVNFNNEQTLFDALRSTDYVALPEVYQQSQFSTNGVDVNLIGVPDKLHKWRTLQNKQRIFISYNQCKFDALGEKI